MDDFKIVTLPWVSPLIPEPASFALLDLGSLVMLRRRSEPEMGDLNLQSTDRHRQIYRNDGFDR